MTKIGIIPLRHGGIMSSFADLAYLANKYRSLSRNSHRRYKRFPLSKGNGNKRWITAPSPPLKRAQTELLHILQDLDPTPEWVHGFEKGKSILTNASEHVGRKVVLCMDFHDFFPSLHRTKVRYYFKSIGAQGDAPSILANLACYRGGLPQGSPCSPAIANRMLVPYEKWLHEDLRRNNCTMTRYADDITISSDLDLPKDIISTVEKVYAPLHLRFSPKKTKFMRKHKRQKVTGLIVNEKVALPKEARRKLRAFFHHADTVGLIPALQKTTIVRGEGSMLDPFLGYLSFLHMIDPVQAAVYLNEIHKLTGSNK